MTSTKQNDKITIDPSNDSHPLHSLVLSMFESKNQAFAAINSNNYNYSMSDLKIIQQKLKNSGLIFLLYNDDDHQLSFKDILQYLYAEKFITNIINYDEPKKINYFDLCHKMSSILDNNDIAPNKVYVVNCKETHIFEQVPIEQNEEELLIFEQDYESNDGDDEWLTFEPEEDAAPKMGFAVGGAKDVKHFRQCILDENIKPNYDSITYNGIFYEYYFDTKATNNGNKGEDEKEEKQKNKKDLFYATYCYGRNKLPEASQYDNYISIGLNSNIKVSNFKRPILNLVMVLDISGSMSWSFNSNQNKQTKLEVAKQCLIGLLTYLNKDDSFGLVLFDHESYIKQPLKLMKDTNIDELKNMINDIQPKGGTNMVKGYKTGISLFENISNISNDMIANDEDDKDAINEKLYQNRILFATDAQPTYNDGDLFELNKKYSNRWDTELNENIYCTFIGIGEDFNDELVKKITSVRGSNYFFVDSNKEFLKIMNEEFELMVSPILFNLTMEIKGCEIDGVYGIDNEDENYLNMKNGQIIKINTLFPSKPNKKKSNKTKGGMVIIKIKNPKQNNIADSTDKKENEYNIFKKLEQLPEAEQFRVEHRIDYEYLIESEFDISYVHSNNNGMNLEELMEHYTPKNEWTNDHLRLLTFLTENEIYNEFDLKDEQLVLKIQQILTKKAINDIKFKRLKIKFTDFIKSIEDINNSDNANINNVTASVESSRYAILLQKHLNKLLVKKSTHLIGNEETKTDIHQYPTPKTDTETKQDVENVNNINLKDNMMNKNKKKDEFALQILIKYEDNNHKIHTIEKNVCFGNKDECYYDNPSIRKAILLTNYVKICKAWINKGHSKLLEYIKTKFIAYFQKESKEIDDNDLLQEIEILNKILSISNNDYETEEQEEDKDEYEYDIKSKINKMKQMILSYNPLQSIITSISTRNEIIHPINIYNTAYCQDFLSLNANIKDIVDYADGPYDSLLTLVRYNKKYEIILVPIYVNLDRNFLNNQCILAFDHEAIADHRITVFYKGLIYKINTVKNTEDLEESDLIYETIKILQQNIDYDKIEEIYETHCDKASQNNEKLVLIAKDENRRNESLSNNSISQWLVIGCGSIFLHHKNGKQQEIKYTSNEHQMREKFKKLLFLCNIDCWIPYNDEIVSENTLCPICQQLLIHPSNIGNSDCPHIFCMCCIKSWYNSSDGNRECCPLCRTQIKQIRLLQDLKETIKQNTAITVYKQLELQKYIQYTRTKISEKYRLSREKVLLSEQQQFQNTLI